MVTTLQDLVPIITRYDDAANRQKLAEDERKTAGQEILGILKGQGMEAGDKAVQVTIPTGMRSVGIQRSKRKVLNVDKLLAYGVPANVIEAAWEEKEGEEFVVIRPVRE